MRLPCYAIPLFLRLGARAGITATFKLRKVELQRQGYDPVRAGDPLLLLDEEAGGCVPHWPAALARLGVTAFAGYRGEAQPQEIRYRWNLDQGNTRSGG